MISFIMPLKKDDDLFHYACLDDDDWFFIDGAFLTMMTFDAGLLDDADF